MVEPKKPMKKKELTRLDEEIASKLQAEFDEEVRLVREKAEKEQEANVVLTKEWDDIQAKIEADHELAQKLQAQEQEELSDAKKARLIVQLLEKRRKHFVAKRAKEKRNIPPTRSQQRSIICTYLKNMEGWKPKSLKNKTELVEESSKKAKTKQEESSKKDEAEIAQESNDGDDVNIDATPLSTKSPTIVDYKIYKEGKKSYFQIIRAGGNSQMYLTFGKMLKNFNREDLEVLWSIEFTGYAMTTLAEHIIIAGAENRPLMLEKSMYDPWASRILLFVKGKKHGRMMLDSINNGPLVYPTVEENRQTRTNKYSELTEAQQLQDDYDVQATNIILHGLPPDVLYNLFDKFAHVPGETLYEYYWRFYQLINDMHTIGMTMQQVQVNTKFLNALPSEWSKFVTNVKLAKSLYSTNYDQLYAYLSQHERHTNEVCINHERYLDSLAFVANSPTLYNPSQSLQHSGEDPIECINKAMAFLSVVASRFPPLNNQLRTSSNPRNQATIQDGEGHMARQYTQPKRPRNVAWFKEKLMLAEAQEADQILDEEQLVFLAYPDDLDAYDSDCDDLSLVKAVLMANLSSCDPKILSEVPYSDSYPNDMIHSGSNIIPYSQYLQETQDAVIQDTNPSTPNDLLVLSLVEQMTDHVAHLDKENQTNKMVNESLTAELERYKERIAIFEQRLNEINTLRETLSNNVKEKESLSKTLTVFKTESKEKESNNAYANETTSFYDDTHKQALGYQNPFHLKKAQRIQPTLYDGNVIAEEHVVISVNDDEETLILEEESRSKMLDKQNDLISIEKKINISPIDYSKLNKIKEDFGKRFVTKKELSTEQAF
ncbi:hypothetical protein Tco_0817799 [Tanacetum coccineum]